MRILSPNNAPPVLRFDGSTEITPMFFSGKSIKNLRINSSTSDDLPDPPVPVIPRTGASAFVLQTFRANRSSNSSCLFSANDINRAMDGTCFS